MKMIMWANVIGQKDTTIGIQSELPEIRTDTMLPERGRIIGATVANNGPRKNEDMCGDVEEAIRKTTAGAGRNGTMKMKWVQYYNINCI